MLFIALNAPATPPTISVTAPIAPCIPPNTSPAVAIALVTFAFSKISSKLGVGAFVGPQPIIHSSTIPLDFPLL